MNQLIILSAVVATALCAGGGGPTYPINGVAGEWQRVYKLMIFIKKIFHEYYRVDEVEIDSLRKLLTLIN